MSMLCFDCPQSMGTIHMITESAHEPFLGVWPRDNVSRRSVLVQRRQRDHCTNIQSYTHAPDADTYVPEPSSYQPLHMGTVTFQYGKMACTL